MFHHMADKANAEVVTSAEQFETKWDTKGTFILKWSE